MHQLYLVGGSLEEFHWRKFHYAIDQAMGRANSETFLNQSSITSDAFLTDFVQTYTC